MFELWIWFLQFPPPLPPLPQAEEELWNPLNLTRKHPSNSNQPPNLTPSPMVSSSATTTRRPRLRRWSTKNASRITLPVWAAMLWTAAASSCRPLPLLPQIQPLSNAPPVAAIGISTAVTRKIQSPLRQQLMSLSINPTTVIIRRRTEAQTLPLLHRSPPRTTLQHPTCFSPYPAAWQRTPVADSTTQFWRRVRIRENDSERNLLKIKRIKCMNLQRK